MSDAEEPVVNKNKAHRKDKRTFYYKVYFLIAEEFLISMGYG